MIVDASVLVALLREEPESARFVPILAREYGSSKISVANWFEAAIVIDSNNDSALSERLATVMSHFAIEMIPVSIHHVVKARDVYAQFGKGRHPARLNFGDCFAYVLSWETSEPLLFKGDDFTKTDVRRVA